MDDRQTISDLKKAAVARVGKHFKEMGCPDGVGRVRLSEVIVFFVEFQVFPFLPFPSLFYMVSSLTSYSFCSSYFLWFLLGSFPVVSDF